jgi:homoserine dehydrogenase
MPSTAKNSPPQIRVALAGLGTVGQGVVRLLQEEGDRYRKSLGVDLRLVLILDRSYRKKDTSWISSDVKFTDSLDDFLEAPSDVIVELLGGQDPADQMIRKGLEQGKSVVTANKLLMARFGSDYVKLAAQRNAYLGFEASVAGGIPIIQVVSHSIFPDRISQVRGILNGTSNFILSQMADGGSDYRDALSEAQSLGYAEADPTLDVSGEDARDKLAILSALCFHTGVDPDQIPTQGVTEITPVDFVYARRLDATIKLLGVATKNGSEPSLRVGPYLIDNGLPLSKISGVLNAVEVTGETLGSVLISGKGAGEGPTAVSVAADILEAARRKKNFSQGVSSESGSEIKLSGPVPSSSGDERYPFYLRFFIKDRPGIISTLAQILGKSKINIDLVLQENWADRSNYPFVITVEPTLFSSMQEAIEEMKKLDFNRADPLALPVLKE